MSASKRIFCTGGSGFLGRAILRRVARGDLPWSVTCYSRSEHQQEICRLRYPNARYLLGDVRDLEHLAAAMTGHDIVIHAAAVKFVDFAELNAQECVSVNIGGSQTVIAAARRAGIERVVGISSDKSCAPVNVYGMSKAVMERLFAEASLPGGTTFTCVRYGNVVGSTGSVIPKFRQQALEQGRVQITNPRMTRFWMSVEEAIDLILMALTLPSPGAVFVPLVRAMTIEEVAMAAVGDIPREIIGTRPGEKEHERLIHFEESVRVERFEDHFELYPPGHRTGTKPFTLSSQNPHYWGDVDWLRATILDAEGV